MKGKGETWNGEKGGEGGRGKEWGGRARRRRTKEREVSDRRMLKRCLAGARKHRESKGWEGGGDDDDDDDGEKARGKANGGNQTGERET